MIKIFIRKTFQVLNKLVKHGNWFNEKKFPDCRKFTEHSTFNLDVINLGSTSGVYAFNYQGLNIKAANWAMSHNPLACDEAILKNYVSFFKSEGTIAILSLCPFSSLSGSYDFFEDRYYTILYPSSIPNFSKRKQAEVLAIYKRPLFYIPLYDMLKDIRSYLKRPFSKSEKTLTEEQMENNAQRWFNIWLKEFSVKDFSLPLSLVNQDGLEDAAKHLNNMIAICKEHNAIPVLVLPPMYHTLAEKFAPSARKILIDSMISRIGDKSVRFLNYMDDFDFSNDRNFFKDSYFLNQNGAKAFTKRVLTDIGLI